MREIKFRAWDKAGDSWMPSKVIQDLLVITVPNDPGEGIFGIGAYHPQRYEFMQYTGLKAKGVEIYEGDVLRWVDESEYFDHVVAWVERIAGFGLVDRLDIKSFVSNLPTDGLNEYEVIGNIYENPELLEHPNE